ncbi:MAG: chromosome segregation protein SMC, partial [Anaerolineae bacterium]
MRLKSLVLQGYKTFAGRTTFELAERVTCIVGPNGSGKSNIADAIRWVLGEQSYGLLRGKRTSDMIFHGSDQRPRAGMASVEILFDNSDGWLPVEFTEVSIGRRAYRDGTNEYLINGQKVRLKDVLELLGNSGLSERTYTIIGQGLVDSALSLRADERRRLFEEAAGIGLYRARREEAKRRLENTRRNLERVEDILAELKPRLRSLERQAERARQYRQVEADLRLLLKEWYGYHWNKALKELGEAQALAQQEAAVLEEVRARQADLEQRVAAFRENLQGVRARLGSWHRQMSQLHAHREEIARRRAVTEERLRSLEAQKQQREDALQRALQREELWRERLEAAGEECRSRERELQEAVSRQQAAQDELEARRQARQQAVQALRQQEDTLQALLTRQAAARARLEEYRHQAQRQREELRQMEARLQQAAEQLRHAEAGVQTAQQQLSDAQHQLAQAEETFREQQGAVSRLEQARSEAQDALRAAEARLESLQARLRVLEQAEAALSGYAAGTQVLLRSVREGRLRGAQGALSSHLQVEPRFETAIAAALGEFLDAVLLQQDEELDAALDTLLSNAARGAVLPLDSLSPDTPLDVEPAEGVFGLAADLVESPPELRPAVDLLLGRTVVVQDR